MEKREGSRMGGHSCEGPTHARSERSPMGRLLRTLGCNLRSRHPGHITEPATRAETLVELPGYSTHGGSSLEHSSRSHLIRASHKATALMGPTLGRVFLEAPHATHCPERFPTVEVNRDSTLGGAISEAQSLPPPRAPLKAHRQVPACAGNCKGPTHTTAPRVRT